MGQQLQFHVCSPAGTHQQSPEMIVLAFWRVQFKDKAPPGTWWGRRV